VTAARSRSVSAGIASRSVRKLVKNPPKALSPIVTPLLFFIAFAGALSALEGTRGFGYYDYTAFQFVIVLFTAAMFVGAFTALDIAIDYQSGMGNRLMVSSPRRLAIVGGYLVVAVGHAAVTFAAVWAVALAFGMPVRGGALEIAGLVALGLLLNVITTLYGAGIALRLQSTAAGVLILIPVFVVTFTTPVFAPREDLDGWLHAVASVNPLTPLVEAGRGFLADDPVSVGLAFATAGGLVIAFAAWAARGMRRAEQGPGARPRRRRRRGRA
jgi:ABC-2 type transport system permease protein